MSALSDLYQEYIECLNNQRWHELENYVDRNVAYNGQIVGLAAYREARENEFREIPDLQFSVSILVCDEKMVASRLDFDISPIGKFLGMPVNGRRISFSEHAFYEFDKRKIVTVWSVIDKAAIQAELPKRHSL